MKIPESLGWGLMWFGIVWSISTCCAKQSEHSLERAKIKEVTK